MITIKSLEVKEASRVYGDYIEKQAFSLDINPVNIAASVAGGYAASKTYNKIGDKQRAEELAKRTIENDHYANVQNLLQHLKIVFTPINVIYSVNNQVFEIIKVDEMSEDMKRAFLNKDANFYRYLLLKKINVELQLAEQFFARSLLQSQIPEQFKTACLTRQWFEKTAFDNVLERLDSFEKQAKTEMYTLHISLDAFRPFASFVEINTFEKVANYFSRGIQQTLSRKDIESLIKVGFLPDRVLFTVNGQLLEQLPVMQMNDSGFNAFKKRDKDFFINFFLEQLRIIESSIVHDVATGIVDDFNKEAKSEVDEDTAWEDLASLLVNTGDELTEEEQDALREEIGDVLEEKQAATLEDVRSSWDEHLSVEKSDIDIWKDPDIHPIAYDWLLDATYGESWHEMDLSALMQQIIADFNIEQINTIAYDKIAMLGNVQNENHSVYLTDFTFEKFLRTMNSLDTDMENFEGGIQFEQFLFGMEIISTLANQNEIYYEFGEDVPTYVAKILKADNIRFISDQVYDETIEAESSFYDAVNSVLLRLWKEEDSLGLTGEVAEKQRIKTENINRSTQDVLNGFGEKIDPSMPYDSVADILKSESIFLSLSPEEFNTVIDQAGRHIIATMYIKLKYQEFLKTIELLEGVVTQNES